MKKIFFLMLICSTCLFIKVQAQTYNTAIGLGIEVGDGATLVGPTVKHFFTENSAVQGELTFGGGGTFIGAYYQYHGGIPNAEGLQYYLGGGPALGFGGGSTDFYVRPMAGLDYKINNVPIALSFDWRPTILIGTNSDFTAARFGIGFKFVLP
jgi:hypothetical protein